jgi:hypothetical protein
VGLRMIRAGLAIALVAPAAWPGAAAAAPVSFAHGTIDNRMTATRTNAPTGSSFTGSYHAAGDPSAPPPYMRKMVFYAPPGQRFDTSVPERCSATDAELEARGGAACPAGSRIGGGTVEGSFLGFPTKLDVESYNAADAMIMVASSPGLYTVMRGHIAPDQSVEWASPTCFPSAQPAPCPVDDALQLASTVTVPARTRADGGIVRSYMTTAPSCPKSGHWNATVRLWWADGTTDTVLTPQPCTRPARQRVKHKRR